MATPFSNAAFGPEIRILSVETVTSETSIGAASHADVRGSSGGLPEFPSDAKGPSDDLPSSVLKAEGIPSYEEAGAAKAGRRIRTGGVVLIRQRPGKGNAVFITIEDETGIVNVLLWANLLDRFRREVMTARLVVVEGEVQRSKEGVVHLMASHVFDRTELLDLLTEETPRPAPGRFGQGARPMESGHPRDVRILPRSRDFQLSARGSVQRAGSTMICSRVVLLISPLFFCGWMLVDRPV